MVRADILNPVSLDVVDTCTGPEEYGLCPWPQADGTVPCAGMLLDAQAPDVHWALRMQVGAHATRCPLRCFVLDSR